MNIKITIIYSFFWPVKCDWFSWWFSSWKQKLRCPALRLSYSLVLYFRLGSKSLQKMAVQLQPFMAAAVFADFYAKSQAVADTWYATPDLFDLVLLFSTQAACSTATLYFRSFFSLITAVTSFIAENENSLGVVCKGESWGSRGCNIVEFPWNEDIRIYYNTML